MLESIIIGFILFLLIFGILYLILFYPIKWMLKTRNIKAPRLYSALIISLIIVSYFVFYSPVKNNDIAEIKANENGYELRLTGKKSYMSHEFISLFSKDTYSDTLRITLPRKQGIINGGEIANPKGYYEYLGTITIENNKVNVDLYYDNYDDNSKDELVWNGKYEILESIKE